MLQLTNIHGWWNMYPIGLLQKNAIVYVTEDENGKNERLKKQK